MNLNALIYIAVEAKPRMGETCNRCGWCCMTETCSVAKDLGAGDMIPCKFLKVANNKGEYNCSLAGEDNLLDMSLGIGTGCDAKTQLEVIQEYDQQ